MSETLLKQLNEASYQLISAYHILDAICKNYPANLPGVNTAHIKARADAWNAYVTTANAAHAHR